MNLRYILMLLAIVPMTATGQDYTGSKSDIDSILDAVNRFSRSYMRADYEGLANFYAREARILPPGADIIQGRSAIKQRWLVPEGVKILHHKVTPVEIKVIGEYAYDVGYYEGKTRRRDQSEVSWRGKYLIVWKKEEGHWRIYLDAWNRIDD